MPDPCISCDWRLVSEDSVYAPSAVDTYDMTTAGKIARERAKFWPEILGTQRRWYCTRCRQFDVVFSAKTDESAPKGARPNGTA